MKKFIIFIVLLYASFFAFAQAPSSIYVQKEDGTTQSALLVTIEKITFEADVLVINTSEGEFHLPLDNIDKITFAGNTTTTVENVQSNAIRFLLSDDQLTIESDYAIKHLYVVNISGQVLINKTLTSVNKASVTLPNSGVFVMCLKTNQGYLVRTVIRN